VPLLAIQILWINLVTDGLPAVALGFEPGEADVMKREPRPPRESILAQGVGRHVVWVGIWLGIVTLLGYVWALDRFPGGASSPSVEGLRVGRTVAFMILALSQVFHVSAIHGGEASFLAAPITRNRLLLAAVALTAALQFLVVYTPFGNTVFETVPLDSAELLVSLLLASSVFFAVEVEKSFRRRRASGRPA